MCSPFPELGGGHNSSGITLNMIKNLKKKYYRFKAKWSLINRYEYLNEVDKLMESYQTQMILRGGSEEFIRKSRAQLSESQARMREQENLIKFLRNK